MAITPASGKIIFLHRTGAKLHGAYHFCRFFKGMFCSFSVYLHNVHTFFELSVLTVGSHHLVNKLQLAIFTVNIFSHSLSL